MEIMINTHNLFVLELRIIRDEYFCAENGFWYINNGARTEKSTKYFVCIFQTFNLMQTYKKKLDMLGVSTGDLDFWKWSKLDLNGQKSGTENFCQNLFQFKQKNLPKFFLKKLTGNAKS